MNFVDYTITLWNKKSFKPLNEHLINEEPLLIKVQGKSYLTVMRTSGDELAHVAGFLFTKGILDKSDDLISFDYCNEANKNVASVFLKQSNNKKIVKPFVDNSKINIEKALKCLEELSTHQPLRNKTRASHAAALYNTQIELLSIAEDVGRHNALDKAVGKVFLNQKIEQAFLLILSSRINYELVQKAATARVPVILAISRPTCSAVKLATRLNMTLACLAKEKGLYIFCGGHRFSV